MAGLLWKLLPAKYRDAVNENLNADQIKKLNKAYKNYTQLESRQKAGIETALMHQISRHRPLWPVVMAASGLALTVFLFIIYAATTSAAASQPWITAQIFSPLLIGSVGFLACYLVSPARLRSVLYWQTGFETALYGLLSLLGLIFLLAFIREDQALFYRPKGAELYIYMAGAVLAPFFEEFFFREYLPSQTGKDPNIAGHAISGIIFAVLHLPDSLLMFAAYLLCAYFLSACRIQSRGILMPYAVHALANGTILFL